MVRVFSWEYFSFLNIDEAAAYKEMLILPLLVPILFFIWMKLVSGEKDAEVNINKDGISIQSAFQDTRANEIDSGTELDSPDEAEEETAEKKDEDEKKED